MSISLIDSALPPIIIGLSLSSNGSLILFSPTIIVIQLILRLLLNIHIHVHLVVILIPIIITINLI